MKILEICPNCKKKGTIQSIHYYDKSGKWKTDPIAFIICNNCFNPYRFERLPFFDDIQFLGIYLGSNKDKELFKEIANAKGSVTCLYCGNAEADFSYIYTDSDGVSHQRVERKKCVIKLHTKNTKIKSDRRQVGYLCGYCKRAYFNNKEMKFSYNIHWAKMIHKLHPEHPGYSEKKELELNELYEKREEQRKEIELKPHVPKEREKLLRRLDRIEELIEKTNHIALHSLGAYPIRIIGA